ncbi:hypothetical protein SESBI_04780 [Sesbania bispinosa]|nr:hypothetical protein SESBI_04780 [Sesbania bispinosa]
MGTIMMVRGIMIDHHFMMGMVKAYPNMSQNMNLMQAQIMPMVQLDNNLLSEQATNNRNTRFSSPISIVL